MKNYTSIQDVENLDQLVQEAIELKKSPFDHKHLGENYFTIRVYVLVLVLSEQVSILG